jgi:hypothetical protein
MKNKHFAIILLLFLFSSCTSTSGDEVIIAFTTSVEGEYASCGCPRHPLGGLSKRAKYIEELRNREKNIIVLDSGDLFFQNSTIPLGSETQWQLKARLIADSYAIMGVDAIGIGEIDLAMGADFLKELTSKNHLAFIASNIDYPSFKQVNDDKQTFSPFKIIQKGSKKIGIISLLHPGLLKSPSENIEFKALDSSLDDLLKTLRNEPDITILLSHLPPVEEENLLKKRDDINIIISSHYGYSQTPIHINNGIIVTAGNRGKYLGILRLKFHGKGPYKLTHEGKESGTITYSEEWVPVEQDLKNHPEIDKLIENYNKSVAQLNLSPSVIEQIKYAGAETCMTCHPKQYNFWRTTKHAFAYNTLEREQKNLDPECIGCHTTGFKMPGGFTVPANVGKMKNVQCEACHINSTEHANNMGKLKQEKTVPEAVCRGCHSAERSPDFNYTRRLPLISCPGG